MGVWNISKFELISLIALIKEAPGPVLMKADAASISIQKTQSPALDSDPITSIYNQTFVNIFYSLIDHVLIIFHSYMFQACCQTASDQVNNLVNPRPEFWTNYTHTHIHTYIFLFSVSTDGFTLHWLREYCPFFWNHQWPFLARLGFEPMTLRSRQSALHTYIACTIPITPLRHS